MAKKPSESETIELIRKILDNPNKSISDIDNKYINTLQRRLRNQPRLHLQDSSIGQSEFSSLRPTVKIHKQGKDINLKVEQSKQILPIQNEELTLEGGFFKKDEDLFEIEHVSEGDIPAFIELESKDQLKIFEKTTNLSQSSKDQKQYDTLPKWELVEEDAQSQLDEKNMTETDEEIPEFKDEVKGDTQIWESADHDLISDEKIIKKKPFFKKFTLEKKSFEEPDDKLKIQVIDLKSSIKKLQKTDTNKAFQFNGYTLYQKEMDLGNNKKRVIHFFSKNEPENSVPSPLPKDYDVKINKKTGVPYIRKKEQ
jgi:hypothetical protein